MTKIDMTSRLYRLLTGKKGLAGRIDADKTPGGEQQAPDELPDSHHIVEWSVAVVVAVATYLDWLAAVIFLYPITLVTGLSISCLRKNWKSICSKLNNLSGHKALIAFYVAATVIAVTGSGAAYGAYQYYEAYQNSEQVDGDKKAREIFCNTFPQLCLHL
jgi:hypothetical protein